MGIKDFFKIVQHLSSDSLQVREHFLKNELEHTTGWTIVVDGGCAGFHLANSAMPEITPEKMASGFLRCVPLLEGMSYFFVSDKTYVPFAHKDRERYSRPKAEAYEEVLEITDRGVKFSEEQTEPALVDPLRLLSSTKHRLKFYRYLRQYIQECAWVNNSDTILDLDIGEKDRRPIRIDKDKKVYPDWELKLEDYHEADQAVVNYVNHIFANKDEKKFWVRSDDSDVAAMLAYRFWVALATDKIRIIMDRGMNHESLDLNQLVKALNYQKINPDVWMGSMILCGTDFLLKELYIPQIGGEMVGDCLGTQSFVTALLDLEFTVPTSLKFLDRVMAMLISFKRKHPQALSSIEECYRKLHTDPKKKRPPFLTMPSCDQLKRRVKIETDKPGTGEKRKLNEEAVVLKKKETRVDHIVPLEMFVFNFVYFTQGIC